MGRINWEGGSEDASFQLSTASYSVAIRCRDADARPPYLLEVYDGQGRVVDSLISGSRTDVYDDTVDQPWNDLLEHLWVVARRNASNVDAVIGQILSELPAVDEPPF